MSSNVLIALGSGVLSAVASMAIITNIPGGVLLVYLAPLPLLLVGLGLGTTTTIIAAAAGFIFTGLVAGISGAGLYLIVNALPAWMLVRYMLSRHIGADGNEQWPSTGPAIAWLSVLGISILILAAMVLQNGETSVEATVATHLNNAFAAILPTISEIERAKLMSILVPFFPGTVCASWLIMTLANGALAQTILVRMGRNLRPSPELTKLQLPHWTSWVLIGAATVALLGPGQMEYISRNITLVMATPFFFLGLAVVHYAARHITFPGTLLTFFYFILLVSGWATLVVVGFGMIEQWAGLRKRFSAPANTSGDE